MGDCKNSRGLHNITMNVKMKNSKLRWDKCADISFNISRSSKILQLTLYVLATGFPDDLKFTEVEESY